MRMPAKNRVTAIVRSIIGEGGRPMAQPDFCKLVGISESHLSKIESSRAVPLSKEFAMLIEHHCGVDAGWLLESNPRKKPVAPDGEPFTREKFEMRRAVLDSAKPIDPSISAKALRETRDAQSARAKAFRAGKTFEAPELSQSAKTHFLQGAARMQLATEGTQTFVDGLRQCERLFHIVEMAGKHPNGKVVVWRIKQLLGRVEDELRVPARDSVFDIDGGENLAAVAASIRSFISNDQTRTDLREWFTESQGIRKNGARGLDRKHREELTRQLRTVLRKDAKDPKRKSSGTLKPKGKTSPRTRKRGRKNKTGRH